MESFSNILVLMEPEGEEQPAFDAALAFARCFGAKLDLFISDFQDLSAAYYAPMVASISFSTIFVIDLFLSSSILKAEDKRRINSRS